MLLHTRHTRGKGTTSALPLATAGGFLITLSATYVPLRLLHCQLAVEFMLECCACLPLHHTRGDMALPPTAG
jgi:hypothetical protein